MEYAIYTKDIEIIKYIMEHGYNDCINTLRDISEFKNLDLIKLLSKNNKEKFNISDIKYMTKEIFLWLYENNYHKKRQRLKSISANTFTVNIMNDNSSDIRRHILTYIMSSKYDEEIIEHLLYNEDLIDCVQCAGIDYCYVVEWVGQKGYNANYYHFDINVLLEKVENIKNKYDKIFDTLNICEDIWNIIHGYIFKEPYQDLIEYSFWDSELTETESESE